MRHITKSFCLLIFLSVFSVHLRGGEDHGWVCRNEVKKLYSTPLGSVFEITTSEPFDPQSKNIFHSIQYQLFKDKNDLKKSKRFVIVDLKIRMFPVADEFTPSEFKFSMTSSQYKPQEILTYPKLQGINEYGPGAGLCPIARFPNKWTIRQGECYSPLYDVMSCRLIIDSKKAVIVNNINGLFKLAEPSNRNAVQPENYLTLGICIEKKGRTCKQLLEVSTPTVRQIDDEKEIIGLANLKMSSYPYDGYSDDPDKIKNENNPDAVYAYGMKLLTAGENLPEALSFLTKAAHNKHILAMYQLGLCYYRGIGVEPDMEKALKWLSLAADYNLPDAVALYAMMQLYKNDFSPFMDESSKKIIGTALDKLDNYTETPDYWLMKSIFKDFHHLRLNFLTLSPKHFMWIVDDYMGRVYYFSKEQYSFNKKYLDYWEHRKYRIPIIRNDETKNLWDKAIDKNYAMALLYKNRILINYSRNLKDGIIMNDILNMSHVSSAFAFNKIKNSMPYILQESIVSYESNKSADKRIAMEAMFCRARLGQLSNEYFTVERDLRFADFPFYHVLKYMTENPDAPGVKEYLSGQYETARKIWKKTAGKWSGFILGAETLYQFYDYGFNFMCYRIYTDDIKDVADALAMIDKAAKDGIPAAQYLAGKRQLDIHRSGIDKLEINRKAIDLLTAAASAGHLKACYLIIKHEFEREKEINLEALAQLAELQKSNDPDAWFLAAEIMSISNTTSKKNTDEIIHCYEQAAKLGSVRALSRLSRLYYKKYDSQRGQQYWSKFLAADQTDRLQEPNDLFGGKTDIEIDDKVVIDKISGTELEYILNTFFPESKKENQEKIEKKSGHGFLTKDEIKKFKK